MLVFWFFIVVRKMLNSGYLLIADISGYTDFVRLHNLKRKPVFGKFMAANFESHATTIISDLLETVIDNVEPTMKLNKLEGDAAFFFCTDDGDRSQSDKIVEAMSKANEAFMKRVSDLLFVQACGCEPCTQSKNLRLKIVAHKGEFSLNTIRNFEELSGEDVILTHRMLKNDIKSTEYWLVTESFYKNLNKSNKSRFLKTVQNLESFNKVKLNIAEFNASEPTNKKIEDRSRLYNWFVHIGYFGSAMFGKKSARPN
jgi:hypothetical protein